MTEEDQRLLRVFAYQLKHGLTEEAFKDIPDAFGVDDFPSLQKIRSRVAFLSGFKAEQYDCCINSCMAYTGSHADLKTCMYCQEARHDQYGFPRQRFTYLPAIPRLISLHSNTQMAEAMTYRGEYTHVPGKVQDVFDSTNYRELRKKDIVIDGEKVGAKFFADKRDIALGFSTDGFAPWKRRKKSAWPLILYNYNLPPETRFHKENIIPLGVIPGPKKPKDFDSFFWPAVQEFLRLLVGVPAFDILTSCAFILRAFLILVSGDMPAVSMVMQIKGHNGRVPCRMCKISGLRVPGSRATTHYVPLDRTRHPDILRDPAAVKKYNPLNLPARTHDEMLKEGRDVMAAPTQAAAERLSKQSGVKGLPILSYLPSLSFPTSFPYDFMHLIWENLIPNLISLWSGTFKGLEEGTHQYQFAPSVWDAIGEATARAGDTLPSIFGPRLGNITQDRSTCTADAWSLWTQYIAPPLLRQRFKHARYYNHFVDLVELLHLCLQFELTMEDIHRIRDGFAAWVEQYEKYVAFTSLSLLSTKPTIQTHRFYYQGSPDRLPACPVTIHALLHIADGICTAGPIWAYWAFPMERFCGGLQRAIKSRRFPWASMNRHLVAVARLTQIKHIYNLNLSTPILSLRPNRPSELVLRQGEVALPECESPPCLLATSRLPP